MAKKKNVKVDEAHVPYHVKKLFEMLAKSGSLSLSLSPSEDAEAKSFAPDDKLLVTDMHWVDEPPLFFDNDEKTEMGLHSSDMRIYGWHRYAYPRLWSRHPGGFVSIAP